MVDDTTPAEPAAAPERADALDRLFASEWSSLVATAYWLLGDQRLAEETVQDAFVRLAESWDTLRDPMSAPAWLQRAVVNLSRSSIRRLITGRRIQSGQRAPAAVEPVELPDPDLIDAVRRLARRQRECIVLRFYGDLTVEQIADTLDLSAGSVKTHLHRALKNLATDLGTPP